MDKMFDYELFWNKALSQIKSVREPRATRADLKDLKWNEVENEVLFEYMNKDLQKYYEVAQYANNISFSCLCNIIVCLLDEYEANYKVVYVNNPLETSCPEMCLIDSDTKSLLVFRKIEECPIFIHNEEPEKIQKIMDQFSLSECKYVYLVYDKAYLQVIGYDENTPDPGKGCNVYSIKWFFETYFGENEYKRFEKTIKDYVLSVKKCIGYNVVKNLTPGSLIVFRKVTENEIYNYPYNSLIKKNFKQYSLEKEEYKKIYGQFNNKMGLCLIGENDFAESLITAEWLYDSMKKAKAIDLTIIGMGYLKAVEQLLYDLICLHKNEGRTIKKDNSFKNLPSSIELNDVNVQNEYIDSTIGSMAIFYRDNLDVFRKDIKFHTRKYIVEAIFSYKDLRNGYFHKHNIHDWETIEDIRKNTYEILFLLLGAKDITEEHKKKLGFLNETYSDYYRLCEYVNYHCNEIFYLKWENKPGLFYIGLYDPDSKVVEDKYIEYSGAYFKPLGAIDKKSEFKLDSNDLPQKISLGKYIWSISENRIGIKTVEEKTVYEKNKFVGPLIAEEGKLDY